MAFLSRYCHYYYFIFISVLQTDLENTDYTCEAGATRLFEAERLARKMDEEERKKQEADEMNPMKVNFDL